jgi:hypothetical protein
VKPLIESAALLDRGGRPTVRELLGSLVFDPGDGTIRLKGERLLMQRAKVGALLRRELLRLLGPEEARVFLIRLGFRSGQADARFVRASWPGLDAGDAFTAGTRLHTFTGTVRVETVHNDFDLRRGRFSGEFLWHDSAEAAEALRLPGLSPTPTSGPVCWMQVGFASGYASEFFGTLIVYKEVQCCAEGHRTCRVVGKSASGWGQGDPEVALYRERVAPAAPDASPRPAPKGLDDLILAPVRERLERLGPTDLPVLVAGEAGTGRRRAVEHLQGETAARHLAGAELGEEGLALLAGRGKSARGTCILDDVQAVPPSLQPRLAAAIEGRQGPRLFALGEGSSASLHASLRPELWFALAPGLVAMPSLAERSDRAALGRTLLSMTAERLDRSALLDREAERWVAAAPWRGNLPEMRAVLTASLLRAAGTIGADLLIEEAARLALPPAQRSDWVTAALDGGGLSLGELEGELYDAALARTGGNMAAAARLLGLTRAQLAYRVAGRRSATA